MKSRHSERRRITRRGTCPVGRARDKAPTPRAWIADDGCHLLLPGVPSPELLDEISRNFQEQLRRPPLWEELIQRYGFERAEQILQQCRAQLA